MQPEQLCLAAPGCSGSCLIDISFNVHSCAGGGRVLLLLRLYGEEPSLISSALELFKVTGQQVLEPYSPSPAICSSCRLISWCPSLWLEGGGYPYAGICTCGFLDCLSVLSTLSVFLLGEPMRLPVNPYLAKSIGQRQVHPVPPTPPPTPVYPLIMVSMQVTVPSSSRISGSSWSWAVPEVTAVGAGDRAHHQPHSRDSLWCTQGHQFIKEQNPILERTWVHRQDIRVQILSHCLLPTLWSQ